MNSRLSPPNTQLWASFETARTRTKRTLEIQSHQGLFPIPTIQLAPKVLFTLVRERISCKEHWSSTIPFLDAGRTLFSLYLIQPSAPKKKKRKLTCILCLSPKALVLTLTNGIRDGTRKQSCLLMSTLLISSYVHTSSDSQRGDTEIHISWN